MKIRILSENKTAEDLFIASGIYAGMCYSDCGVDLEEDKEKARKRANFCLNHKHHSIFDHTFITLEIIGSSKIFNMFLNSMGSYNTSERSGRYTKFTGNDLYDKWENIFEGLIKEKYPDLENTNTVVRENARYVLSIFHPTDIVYTVSLRQLNYLMWYMENFPKEDNEFSKSLHKEFQEFSEQLKELRLPNLDNWKKPTFDFMDLNPNVHVDIAVNDLYSVQYLCSFSCLAQAQRHRTLKYKFSLDTSFGFYIPPIIKGTELEIEWIYDLNSIKHTYPQAMLVLVTEQGTISDFKLKADERMCGEAQLEIMESTRETLLKLKPNSNGLLDHYVDGQGTAKARCRAGFKCKNICYHTGKRGVDRLI